MSNPSRLALIRRCPLVLRFVALSYRNHSGAGTYGVIGQIKAATGQRDALIDILRENETGMPGCQHYLIAKDAADPDMTWITEVWDSKDQHEASLTLPSVQSAIAKARPIIAGFGHRFETEPV